jgi:probable HAF family extracellular repeat protein
VTILQYPFNCGIGEVTTRGSGLNKHDAVVGSYDCPIWEHAEAFLWTPEEGFTSLQRPPGVSSAYAVDISDRGVIVGTYIVPDVGGFRGFVYEDGKYTELPPLPGGAWSQAFAITNARQVVGFRSIGEGVNPFNAFIWSAETGFTDLGVMEGPNSAATDISENGFVVGWTGGNFTNSTAFLWNEGAVTILGPVPQGDTSFATAVTNNAEVCGSGKVAQKGKPFGITRAFLWREGKFTMLGTLPDHLHSAASDMNELRQVVGTSSTVDGDPNIDHGFIWQKGVITDLNDLISPDLELVITSTAAINGRGQIVGRASTVSDLVAVLLTPQDPPLGDLDVDCSVDIADLLRLLAVWGPCPDPPDECPADLNGDGAVGIADLQILLANWG